MVLALVACIVLCLQKEDFLFVSSLSRVHVLPSQKESNNKNLMRMAFQCQIFHQVRRLLVPITFVFVNVNDASRLPIYGDQPEVPSFLLSSVLCLGRLRPRTNNHEQFPYLLKDCDG
jgi:hypothetical protein